MTSNHQSQSVHVKVAHTNQKCRNKRPRLVLSTFAVFRIPVYSDILLIRAHLFPCIFIVNVLGTLVTFLMTRVWVRKKTVHVSTSVLSSRRHHSRPGVYFLWLSDTHTQWSWYIIWSLFRLKSFTWLFCRPSENFYFFLTSFWLFLPFNNAVWKL